MFNLETNKEIEQAIIFLVHAFEQEKPLDKKTRYMQTFERILKYGKDAFIVKAADILDNSHYWHFATPKVRKYHLTKKTKHFLTNSKKLLAMR